MSAMASEIAFSNLVLTPGARAGLADATATCDWVARGLPESSPDAQDRLRQRVGGLWPAEPLPGIAASDWPQAFLIGADSGRAVDWCVALAVAIQRLAGDPVGRGMVHIRGETVMLAIPWQRSAVLKAALEFAARYLALWLGENAQAGASAGKLDRAFEQWLVQAQAGGLTSVARRFALAARDRDIPVAVRLKNLWLGWGCGGERMNSSITGRTSSMAVRFARRKIETSRILHDGGVPVPRTSIVSHWPQVLEAAGKMGWPVVIKPSNQEQGIGVVPDITDEAGLRSAFDAADKLSPQAVIVEKHVAGSDYRMLVVGGKLLAVARRDPAAVSGDGRSTVIELNDEVNRDPRRGRNNKHLMAHVVLDDEALQCLARQGLEPTSVPAAGQWVRLRRTANISTGGTAADVTDQVHPDNRVVAERSARLLGLDIAGVDFLCPDISRSWHEVGGAVCEVNAQPGFRPHWLGNPDRDVTGEIIDWMFRDHAARIPTTAVIAVTDGHAIARMVHRVWTESGRVAGVASSEGVWIGADLILRSDSPGLREARVVLEDPAVQAAVMELPITELSKLGHPCDRYDVVSVFGRHAEADALVLQDALQRASRAVVLDAETAKLMPTAVRQGGPRRILVANQADLPDIREQLKQGVEALFLEQRDGVPWIVLADDKSHRPLMAFQDTPPTENTLHAFALALAHGIDIHVTCKALGASGVAEQ